MFKPVADSIADKICFQSPEVHVNSVYIGICLPSKMTTTTYSSRCGGDDFISLHILAHIVYYIHVVKSRRKLTVILHVPFPERERARSVFGNASPTAQYRGGSLYRRSRAEEKAYAL